MSKQAITSADYEGFINDLARAAAADPTFKDYNFNGSGLRALLRILALAGNQQAFIDNTLFNELSLNHAEMRENVGAISGFLGYCPMSAKCADITVDIEVTLPTDIVNPPLELTLQTTDSFVGVKDGISYQFVPLYPVTSPLIDGKYVFSNIRLYQGRWAYNSFTSSDGGDRFVETYQIPNKDIDITTLQISVQDNETSSNVVDFKRYQTPHELGKDATIYFLELGMDNFYNFEFGDGIIAKQVKAPNIVYAKYLITKGEAGNDINKIVPTTPIGGFPNIKVTTIVPSTNGSEPETIQSIKRNAPIAFGTDGLAITAQQYPSVLKRIMPTAKITSWGGEDNVPIMHGYTIVAVKPNGREALSESEKKTGIDYLQNNNVGSIWVKIIDADIYSINIIADINWFKTKTNMDEDAIKNAVTNIIRNYSKEELENFNTEFDPSKLSDFIRVDGVVKRVIFDVTFEKTLKILPYNEVTTTISFRKAITPGSISTSKFDYQFNKDAYVKDDNGTLGIYAMVLGQETLLQECGSVDYENGELKFSKVFPNTNMYTQIRINVIPYDRDLSILSQRNEFLQIKDVTVLAKAV